ncbi:MAG TPA: hypothetical protein ENK15_04265 [Thermopetrobacter sp.]|nr:hypothetical protein [Thermopetrobacter sp.]
MIAQLLGVLAGSRTLRTLARWAAVALTIALFILSFRRTAERAGRLAERLDQLEKANDIQRRMAEAASHRPRSRDELARRLRDGDF